MKQEAQIDTLKSTYLCLIRVGVLCINSIIFLNIIEGLVHQSAHTAMISCRNAVTAMAFYCYLSVQRHTILYVSELSKNYYQPSFFEQSTRFCSERETSLPVFLKCWPSSDPVEENAQHEPQVPCRITGTV